MLQLTNGESPPVVIQGEKRYTAEIVLRTRPNTYRRVVRLLGEGVPVRQIKQLCRVSHDSINAIALRESSEVSARKNSLAALMSNIAEIGGARVESRISKAGVRDAIIGTGVAIDKMLALLGQNPQVAIQVNLPSDADRQATRDMHAKLDALTKRLSE